MPVKKKKRKEMESISYTPPQEMAQMADPVNLPGAKSAKLIKNQKDETR